MALWGISSSTATESNFYNIPKSENGSIQFPGVDREYTPHNVFADVRGWIYREYGAYPNSGLGLTYADEILITATSLNTAGSGSGSTGIGTAQITAVFFEDPNQNSPISVGSGGTAGVTTAQTVNVHVVYNAKVYAGAGATIEVTQYDANGTTVGKTIGYASSVPASAEVFDYTNWGGKTIVSGYNGQITNRVSFALTAPSTLTTVNKIYTSVSVATTVAVGGTNLFVSNPSSVSIGDSITILGKENAEIIAIGGTFVQIGTGDTSAQLQPVGTALTVSDRVTNRVLGIRLDKNIVGVITNSYGTTVSAETNLFQRNLYNVGGAGTYGQAGILDSDSLAVGIGTTTITVTA